MTERGFFMLPATLSPSMMCADIFDLAGCLAAFAAGGVEHLHIDVMDGVFVPNFCLGTDYCRRLRQKRPSRSISI